MSSPLESDLPEIFKQLIGAQALFKVSTTRVATNLQRNHTPTECDPVIQGVRAAAKELYPNHHVVFSIPGGRSMTLIATKKPILRVVMKNAAQEPPIPNQSGVVHRNYIIKKFSIQQINVSAPRS